MPRKLCEIAREIRADWQNPTGPAVPCLQAMGYLSDINGNIGADVAKATAMYFLSSAGAWKGPVARRIKKELKDMVKGKGS